MKYLNATLLWSRQGRKYTYLSNYCIMHSLASVLHKLSYALQNYFANSNISRLIQDYVEMTKIFNLMLTTFVMFKTFCNVQGFDSRWSDGNFRFARMTAIRSFYLNPQPLLVRCGRLVMREAKGTLYLETDC